ncbi:hypothetical protein FH972_026905 [Carpinus fangiana]|uniref:O-methyltransferase C-terminal domain-containing protein n=1 Tax=Carpinus fangiana TaxID=176857 RepID=A0A5N6L5D4_9ROSI|nr:hypothetical protein FH972_026905 [Carpinus fangiana]
MTEGLTMTELADIVSARTQTLNEYFQKTGSPQPSFASNGPLDIIPDDDLGLQRVRAELVDASRRIADLAAGNVRLSTENFVFGQYNAAVLRFVYRFNVPKHVPLEGSISFHDLAQTTGADVNILRRFVRYAYTIRLFRESSPDKVSHSNASHLLATQPNAWDALGHTTEDMFPGLPFIAECQEKWPGSVRPTETPLHLAFPHEISKDQTYFDWFAAHPQRAIRFGGTMNFLSLGGGFINDSQTTNNFDWTSLGAAQVVDIGGSRGHVSIAILRHAPQLTSIVQDRPEVVSQMEGKIPKDLTGRLTFEVANFFEPQPIKTADVYFFRRIFHDWSDDDSSRIIKNLVPSMKSGSRLVISEFVVKPPGQESMFEEKMTRCFDLQMLVALNGKERTLQDWKDVVELGSGGQLKFELCQGDLIAFKKK